MVRGRMVGQYGARRRGEPLGRRIRQRTKYNPTYNPALALAARTESNQVLTIGVAIPPHPPCTIHLPPVPLTDAEDIDLK
jgi:hypothetical protein